jgi:hypothetical protein
MKITQTQAQIVKLPADEPLAGGPPFYRPFHQFIALDVRTDAGIEGVGYTTFAGPLTATFFGTGYLHPGPGTWGSLATMLIWAAIRL